MKLLLDTNAYGAFLRGHPTVGERVRRSTGVYMSAVVVGELLFGFRAGTRYEKNARELQAFLENPLVAFLAVTHATAERFALVAAGLKRRGTPIPTNDVWIAAHAFETGAELVSLDKHFAKVEGLLWYLPPEG